MENINLIIGTIAIIVFIVFCCCIGLFLCACIIGTFIRAWFMVADFINDWFR